MKGEAGEPTDRPDGEIVATWVSSDGVWHARPHGEMNLSTSPELRQKILAALSSSETTGLVIDLSQTTFADSSFLGALVEAARLAKSQNIPVGLAGMNDRNIRKVLEHLKLDRGLAYVDEEATTDPDVIRRWAESYGAKPALRRHQFLEGTMLAFMFPGQEQDKSFEEISWETFFIWLGKNKVVFQLQPPPGIEYPYYEIHELDDLD